ncbi:MAG TPA: [protein-PII] uridylyltransferase [Jatrophihabitantaceae bacterium]|nr:[protein-PII] uridylyltransferase [Jatrophihabitantaceae bacterium]
MSVTPTPSSSLSLTEVRAGVLRLPGLVGVQLRVELTDAYDDWLSALVPDRPGVALIAVGGLGREEPAPYSDLDLVLLHDGKVDGLSELADAIWYPIWDSGIGLDHSVRTVDQAVGVAKDDLKALLGLLDVRHIAGDCTLWGPLRARVLELWRRTATKRVEELQELCRERWALLGDAAFLLEPNLKDSRGGLRDAHLLHALGVAQLIDFPPAVRSVYPVLLDARGELQRRTGRAEDVLRQQEQQGVAEALGMADDDATPASDVLLRRVNEAARTIAHSLDTAWRRIEGTTRSRRPQRRVFGAGDPGRVGIAPGVVAQDGEVVLARDADPSRDAELVLRAARAAAEHDLPLSDFTLSRLAAEAAPLEVPWPQHAREEFVSILGAGEAAVHVLEQLDLAGLLEPLVPDWSAVRNKAQHNPVHTYTVDRHLLETAAHAVVRTRDVPRPDLLLVGALLHDIGKGFEGDHSVVGAERAATIAHRMGFPPQDVEQITKIVRHHLLLPDTATRRDLDDPATIAIVTDAVGGSADLLDTLHALSIADAAASGPAAWSDWKGGLIRDLVRRAHGVLHGEALPTFPPLPDELRALAATGELAVEIAGDRITVVAPDRIGMLYRTTGVLALHSLDVRSASIRTHEGMAVNTFVVEPRFGGLPDPAVLRSELANALDGNLGLADRLRAKERAYTRSTPDPTPPTVLWFDDEATDATVVEIRTSDAIGLLCRLTAALERCQLDVRSARVSSTAGSVVDAFYVTTREGRPVPGERRPDIETELAGA